MSRVHPFPVLLVDDNEAQIMLALSGLRKQASGVENQP
jgi:hypothetical protein